MAARLQPNQQIWLWRAAAVLLIAAIVHVLAIWALPRIIMRGVFRFFPTEYSAPDAPQRLYRPPMTDARQRGIVMPSPDILYATCVYDLSYFPLRVRADPRLDSYWSIAFYAANTDNFLTVNDRIAAGKPVDILLVSASGKHPPRTVPDGVRVVIASSDRGMVLTRMLVADYAKQKEQLEAARGRISCAYWKD